VAVVINEFEVVPGQSPPPEVARPPERRPPASPPAAAREIERVLRLRLERAARLHAS
jgi:hypothetical protein